MESYILLKDLYLYLKYKAIVEIDVDSSYTGTFSYKFLLRTTALIVLDIS